jgi:toxin ParE1/3/4
MTEQPKLSLEADGDLINIYQYTEKNWGETQATTYIHSLFKVFSLIADNPRLGKARLELGDRIRSHPHRRHVIYYILQNDDPAIARVLHGSMDVERSHLDVVFE